MAGRARHFDPDAIVHRSINRRFGVKTQAEIERDARFAKRVDSLGEGVPTRFDGTVAVDGDLNVYGPARFEAAHGYALTVVQPDGTTLLVAHQGDFGTPVVGLPAPYGLNFDNGYQAYFYSDEFVTNTIILDGSTGRIKCVSLDAASSIAVTASLAVTGTVHKAPDDQWLAYAHADPNANTVSVVGMTAWTSSGTVASANGTSMPFNSYATGAVSGNTAGLVGPAIFEGQWGFDVRFKVNVIDTANVRFMVGVADANPNGTDTPTSNNALFRYSTGAGDTTWRTRRGDGAAGGTGDTGIAIATSNFDLRIVGTSSLITWYVNGTQTNTASTNIPTASTLLAPYFQVTTLTNAAKVQRFNAMYSVGQ